LRTIEQERNAALVDQHRGLALTVGSERVGERAQMTHDLGRELLEQRHHFVADARP